MLSVLVQWKAVRDPSAHAAAGRLSVHATVSSALIRLAFRPPEVHVADPAEFQRLVRSVFTQRRKTLSNALGPFAEGTGLLRRGRPARPALTPAAAASDAAAC